MDEQEAKLDDRPTASRFAFALSFDGFLRSIGRLPDGFVGAGLSFTLDVT